MEHHRSLLVAFWNNKRSWKMSNQKRGEQKNQHRDNAALLLSRGKFSVS
jgi:hypothetical protein